MLAPTPMLKPGPLDLGGLFAGTFEALKRRFGLLVLIALFPSLVALVVIGGGLAIAIPAAVISASGGSRSVPAGIAVGIAVILVGALVTTLAQLKSQAMLTVAAYEIAQGERPDFRGLLARTKGFLPRLAPVIAITVGAVVGLYAVMMALGIGLITASGTRGRNPGAVIGVVALMMVLLLLLIPLTLYLSTKLIYLIPSMAIEQLGGIEGLKRSWRLTRGAFWRTLGYYLVASVAVAAVSSAVSMISQIGLLPHSAGLNDSSSPDQVLAGLAGLIPFLALSLVLQVAVQLVAVPFQQTYVTYMFLDQVRRSEPAPAATTGYGWTPPAPGYAAGQYYAQPGQYYGQPGQYYQPPAQGYPQPGPGQSPAPGWPAPPAGGPQQPPREQWPTGDHGQQPPAAP
ncbi:MAG: glycerophosphoryl diester phosphodiesterase membrane domain-containing protein [Propionicimonas sp.]